ncbi:hypothetical protein AB0I28_15365 [Phytomonospora sp. NPDC050363]|uniref:hypothetical protein n=1 Tax=Phytomonospora sp. NPDC050363 TaxID=3155642 RepID=UPI0033F07C66
MRAGFCRISAVWRLMARRSADMNPAMTSMENCTTSARAPSVAATVKTVARTLRPARRRISTNTTTNSAIAPMKAR